MNLQFPLLSKEYRIHRITEQDIDDVYRLCAQNPRYYHYCPPPVSRAGILQDLSALPPGVAPSDKYYVGFYQSERLIAVLDLILGYPTTSDAYIGFFMTNASLQRQGIGSGIIQKLCSDLNKLPFHSVQLSWVKGNQQVEQFWLKNGFSALHETVSTSALSVIAAKRRLHPDATS